MTRRCPDVQAGFTRLGDAVAPMPHRTCYRVVAGLFLSLILFIPAIASDQDQAREAVQAGLARPLNEILPQIQERFPGRMLDARLEQDGSTAHYILKILAPGGQVSEVTVDAVNGTVLRVR